MNQTTEFSHPINGLRRHGGAITLAMSLILLFLITLITLAVTRNISIEQKVANSDTRSKLAFEAAEAGVAESFRALSDSSLLTVLKNNLADDGSGNLTVSLDVLEPTTTKKPCEDISNASCEVILTALTGTDRFQVQSTGYSDDQSATRTITIRAVLRDALASLPDAPLTSKSEVTIDGATTIYNPEGDTTIWGGETIDLGSNNQTGTEIADPYFAGFPSCMDTPLTCETIPSSNKVTLGPDIVDNDGNLGSLTAAEFFEAYFGDSIADYKISDNVDITATGAEVNSDTVNQQANVTIWIEGAADFGNGKISTYGCSEKVTGANICPANDPDLIDPNAPDFAGYESSIIVVEGDATFSGTVHFYGLVFVTGNLEILGNTTIYGGLVVGGETINDTGGSLDLYYHSGLLENAASGGALFAAAGSWRDY
jgi:Tfp pilus assembly protein PilX